MKILIILWILGTISCSLAQKPADACNLDVMAMKEIISQTFGGSEEMIDSMPECGLKYVDKMKELDCSCPGSCMVAAAQKVFEYIQEQPEFQQCLEYAKGFESMDYASRSTYDSIHKECWTLLKENEEIKKLIECYGPMSEFMHNMKKKVDLCKSKMQESRASPMCMESVKAAGQQTMEAMMRWSWLPSEDCQNEAKGNMGNMMEEVNNIWK